MKSRSASLFLILLLIAAATAAAARKGNPTGGWRSIPDVKDPHVQEIGKFAVTEHNKESKTALDFEDVLSGETQVVAGTNYRLVISAKNVKSKDKYQAVVWEKPWENFKELTSFKSLSNSPVKP